MHACKRKSNEWQPCSLCHFFDAITKAKPKIVRNTLRQPPATGGDSLSAPDSPRVDARTMLTRAPYAPFPPLEVRTLQLNQFSSLRQRGRVRRVTAADTAAFKDAGISARNVLALETGWPAEAPTSRTTDNAFCTFFRHGLNTQNLPAPRRARGLRTLAQGGRVRWGRGRGSDATISQRRDDSRTARREREGEERRRRGRSRRDERRPVSLFAPFWRAAVLFVHKCASR